MISVRTASGAHQVAAIHLRTVTGLREVANAALRTASGLFDVFAPGAGLISIAADTLSAYGSGAATSPVNISTSTVTLTPSGGTAPYSYAWNSVAGWTVQTVSDGVFRFIRSAVEEGAEYTEYFTCTVTDARGNSADSEEISATVVNYGGLFTYV